MPVCWMLFAVVVPASTRCHSVVQYSVGLAVFEQVKMSSETTSPSAQDAAGQHRASVPSRLWLAQRGDDDVSFRQDVLYHGAPETVG